MEAFFRQDALGQPVVQEVDSISKPLEETVRPNGPEVTSNFIATLGNTPVSEFKAVLPSLLEYFQGKTKTFQAGSLAAYSHLWQEITSDPEVLETVTGQRIEFATLPIQENPLMQTISCLKYKQNLLIWKLFSSSRKGLFNLANMRQANLYHLFLQDQKRMAPFE